MVDRLRRIKLLGYASHCYPAADHSRYAHALGTMHVMRSICTRLSRTAPGLLEAAVSEAVHFDGPKVQTVDALVQHLLIAALLQDVGELPFSPATGRVLRAADKVRRYVEGKIGGETSGWSEKDVFSIACLFRDAYCSSAPLNRRLAAFLITGSVPCGGPYPNLRALRQSLDGEADADRLDYVYRDAHHTLGGRGTPRGVIDSLLSYDSKGVVFADPGPVAEFLATRAALWTTVYFSAENRFRNILLVTLLREVLQNEDAGRIVLEDGFRGDLSIEAFESLDDVSLHSRLKDLSASTAVRGLEARARKALDILLGEGTDYDCYWVPPHSEEAVAAAKTKYIPPSDLFFDTFSDYQENHSVYEPGTIRVNAMRFQYLGGEVPLEDCCGAFSGVLKRPWSALERPGSILLFVPRSTAADGIGDLQHAISAGSLHEAVLELDPLGPVDVSADTRDRGFQDPAIFISFSWADVRVVRRLVSVLFRHRRKYYLLLRPFQGVGDTPGRNSVRAVQDAGAVMIVASSHYVNRFRDEPNGNIAKEIYTMRDRLKEGNLPVVCLSADEYGDIKKFPYEALGLPELPFVGTALRLAPDRLIEDAVREALDVIDRSK
ncbi:MAG: hypothetical protein C0504_06135 [Candidatus Solibacter sp.]|nr:hypothetical protein [Candidatus Solibacter sp.]